MSLYFVQPRFEKTCENICVCEKHSRNNTFQCHRRCQLSRQLRHSPWSCHARRSNRTRYPARQQTKPTRYTARLTYQAHALFSAATANPTRYTARRTYQAHAPYSARTVKSIALYSAVNVGSSRAIQRGGSKAKRAIQRGEPTRLARYSARGLPSEDDEDDDEAETFSLANRALSFSLSFRNSLLSFRNTRNS